jgi:hypothetical protein
MGLGARPASPGAPSPRPPLREATPAALVARAMAGDAEVMAALLESQRQRIVGLARFFTGNAADAEDLAQDILIRVMQRCRISSGRRRLTCGSTAPVATAASTTSGVAGWKRRFPRSTRDRVRSGSPPSARPTTRFRPSRSGTVSGTRSGPCRRPGGEQSSFAISGSCRTRKSPSDCRCRSAPSSRRSAAADLASRKRSSTETSADPFLPLPSPLLRRPPS